jgi:Phage integrase, N-terminal SAM-like domain
MVDIDKINGRFQARWRDPEGRQRTKLFDTRRQAADFLAEVRVAARSGVEYQPHGGMMRVRDYAPAWLATMQNLRPNSADLYGSHLRNWIIPQLGDRKLASISRVDCKRFVAALSTQLAPSTVATVYAVLSKMLADALDEGKITANPALRVPLPAREHRVTEPMSAQAVASLAASITPRYEVVVWLGAGAGLRLGECLGLTVARVDFLRRAHPCGGADAAAATVTAQDQIQPAGRAGGRPHHRQGSCPPPAVAERSSADHQPAGPASAAQLLWLLLAGSSRGGRAASWDPIS